MSWDHKQSVKEVIKHLLYKSGSLGMLKAYRRRRGYVTDHLEGKGASERFRGIYRLGTWVHDDGQASRSGRGSEDSATNRLVADLPVILKELDCQSLLDIGCGDWNWMSKTELPCDYIGVDIVPEIIEKNKRYETDRVRFLVANASTDKLPQADVVLCREVLFHLSFDDSMAAIANIKQSANWLIATSDTSIWFNSDIPTGDFRNINLTRSPYNFPDPDKIVRDDALSSGRILGVWETINI